MSEESETGEGSELTSLLAENRPPPDRPLTLPDDREQCLSFRLVDVLSQHFPGSDLPAAQYSTPHVLGVFLHQATQSRHSS